MANAPLLQGLHVLDLASFIAGPAAATILGDFGADVVKVEPPHVGDTYRGLSRVPPLPPVEGVNYPWQLDNRNKRSVALNLKSPESRKVLEKLVAWADVVVINFPPRTRAKLGLEYEDLAPLNPRLIYADVTGFGETGPDAHLPGFDVTAYWARSGLMDVMHQADAPPAFSVPGMGDHVTAVSLFAGIMTALYRREKTGQGSRVTTSLLAEGAWAAAVFLQAMLVGAKSPRPIDRLRPPNAMANPYRTSDGRWLVLVFANEDKQVPMFLQAIGHPEAAENPRYADSASRRANAAEIVGLLDQTFATRTLAEWREVLDAAGLTYGVAQTFEEFAKDPQLVANKIVVPIDDGSAHPPLTVDSPVNIDQEQKVPPRPAPDLGEHTESVLRELGFEAADIDELRKAGAIDGGRAEIKKETTIMSEATETPTVRTEARDGIFVITVDRPEARNAINRATAQQLAAALDELDSRDDLLVGILTGANGVFSAGMDLKAFAAGERPIVPGRGFAGITRADIKKPLIAAVEGYALGGGSEMALACDMIVAARNATFGQTEVHYGIVAPEGGMVRLPERIPRNIALELLLTGDPLPAERAERLGMVNHLTEPGQALDRALELARRVAENAPLALTAVKRVFNERTAFRDQDALRDQDQIVEPVMSSQDAKEGARAFAEKRSPHWQGR